MRSDSGTGSDSGRKTLFMAIAAALLIHALLLVMFNLPEHEKLPEEKKLLKVSSIALNDPGNRNIAGWIKNHDPALMLSPGHTGGYSSVLNADHPRKILEDLPSPPLLSMPGNPENRGNVRQVAAGSSAFELPSETFVLQCNKKSNSTPKSICAVMYRNQCVSGVLEMLKKVPASASVHGKRISKNMTTVLRVLPPRFQDTLPRIELESSCGNAELDSLAMRSATSYFSGTSVDGNYGKMVFFWQEILSENSVAEVKK